MATFQSVIALAIADAVAGAAASAIRSNTSPYFQALSLGLKGNLRDKQQFATVNKRLAAAMQQATLNAYDSRVDARKAYPSYRVGQNRESGGKLRSALAKDTLYTVDSENINYGNRRQLDREAKHWYRLNFGAGSKANELYTGRAVGVRFGRNLGTVRINSAPSESFEMPRGVWEKGRKGRPPGFYPLGQDLVFPTEGIAGRRFLDAGVQEFGRRFQPEYEGLINKFVNDAVQKSRGPLKGMDTNVLMKLVGLAD